MIVSHLVKSQYNFVMFISKLYVFSTCVSGNILTAFPPSVIVETIKLGFVLSIAVSFPLVIFPCRTAIHSLIFRKVSSLEGESNNNNSDGISKSGDKILKLMDQFELFVDPDEHAKLSDYEEVSRLSCGTWVTCF